MRVCDAMTPGPAACEPSSSLCNAAQLMSDYDCAAIPITRSGKLVGIITDRDVACRAVTAAQDAPMRLVSEFMSQPVIAVGPDEPLQTAITLMEENSIHHLPVIRADGTLVGMLAQSDIGRRLTNREFGALARMTSIRARFSRRFVNALVRSEH